jgi:hypothetical protein
MFDAAEKNVTLLIMHNEFALQWQDKLCCVSVVAPRMLHSNVCKMVKLALEQAMKTHRGSRGIYLLFI